MKHREERCNFHRTESEMVIEIICYHKVECKLPLKGPEEGSIVPLYILL